MISNKNQPIKPKTIAIEKGILGKHFVWQLGVRVDQKTQKYFLNDQQQKSTSQTENKRNNNTKNNDFHEKFTQNAILDISAIFQKVRWYIWGM
jgi:hypothetical protein